MVATFVVSLREGFEAALLLGIVYACLDRFGARAHYRWVTLGGALGLVASILMGIAVTLLSGPLLDLGPDLVGAAVIFAAVGLLTWHGWWMSRHAQALRGDVQRRVAEAEATRRLSVLGLIAFTGVFREGAETVLFLWGLVSQTAEGASWDRLAGGALGVATAARFSAVAGGGRAHAGPARDRPAHDDRAGVGRAGGAPASGGASPTAGREQRRALQERVRARHRPR